MLMPLARIYDNMHPSVRAERARFWQSAFQALREDLLEEELIEEEPDLCDGVLLDGTIPSASLDVEDVTDLALGDCSRCLFLVTEHSEVHARGTAGSV